MLKPKSDDEPEGLGPVVERWRLGTGRKVLQAEAIAAGIAEILDDESVVVRDRDGGPESPQTKRPDLADIAVLCRSVIDRDEVSTALQTRGIPTIVDRGGLLRTPEAEHRFVQTPAEK